MTADQRLYPRADLAFKLKYVVAGKSGTSVSRDIAEGGISFQVQQSIPAGQTVHIEMSIGEPEMEFHCDGRCVRCWEEAGHTVAAFQFLNLNPEAAAIIRHTIVRFREEIGAVARAG